mgnify:CR=1 FL=1
MSSMSTLICRKHPHLSWSCKSIAVSDDGRYNGSRNIFFNGKPGERECPCHHSFLVEQSVYDAETEEQHIERINHFNSLENLEMSQTHSVPAGTVSQLQSNTTLKGNTMQTALTNASLSETTRSDGQYFLSDRFAKQMAWQLGNKIGQIATRIQRLASPPKGTPAGNTDETKAEIRALVASVAWGYENIGFHMPTIEEKIAEWCGGGYSRPRSNDQIQAAADALGITFEEARTLAENQRQFSKDWLTIRRSGLAPVMETKIGELISTIDEDKLVEPTDEEMVTAGNKTFHNAVLWGDWAEAQLVKDDLSYHVGKSPEMPSSGDMNGLADKAARIREQLANAQAEAAAKDTEALVAFDINDLAA